MRYARNTKRARNWLDAALDWMDAHPTAGWLVVTGVAVACAVGAITRIGGAL